MRDFITVEDVNTVSYGNQGFYWHEIDTSLISETEDFTDVKYDFVTISREKLDSVMYRFTFEVSNNMWKGYWVCKRNGSDEGVSPSLNGDTITVLTDDSSLILKLYLISFNVEDSISKMYYYLLDNYKSIYLNQTENNRLNYYDNLNRRTGWNLVNLTIGLNRITLNGYYAGYMLVKLLKTDFQFTCTQTVTVGKVNKVYLGTDSDYLPNGDLVGTYTPKITVQYGDETLPVMYDETDYYFNLDLTDKTETGKVRFKVNVEANEVLNSTTTEVALNSQYQTVNTFDAFLTAIANNDVIRLGANLTATSSISVNRSVKIIGNDKTINLSGYNFQLKEDVEFKAENLQLNNGDTTIIQAPNTNVELTSVTFTNCTSSDYNNLGSCIFCDSKAENISIDDDFNTVLTDCQFINNHNAILHGGQLDINRCKFHNTDTSYVDLYNPAFIYQTDGECTILNSVFDIDYGTDYSLCTGEQSIGFSQCIFMCGTTATINAITYDELKGNNLNGFFDNPQNNRAHIYAKYYYPQIETCVFSSPTSGNEDKALCYGLGGDDMIHKINTQVTRADSGNENDTRRISW